MSDAENTTREKIAQLIQGECIDALWEQVIPEGQRFYLGLADALIAAFPMLTTEPNETTRPRAVREVMSLIYKANDEAAARTPQNIEAFANEVVEAVLAVVPNTDEPTDVEVMKLARTLYCADNWGVPSARETWDEGMAFDHDYTRYERLARAAVKEMK